MSPFTFDDFVESAWVDYRVELAVRLTMLAEVGETFTVDRTQDIPEGPSGAIAFTRTADGDLRATISETDLHHTIEYQLTHARTLSGMGWHRPLSDETGTLVYEVRAGEADHLAATAVQVLREVLEVVHPAYVDDKPAPVEPEIDTAILAVEHDQLRQLVIEALEDMRNESVDLDADGDYPLPTSIPSWLRVLRDSPSVRFFALLTDTIGNPAHAAEYLAHTAAKWPYVSLVLDDSGVYALLTHQLWMFHPKNLAAALATWADFLKQDAPEIIAAVAEPADEPLPDALQAILQLEADGPELTTTEIAQICQWDGSATLEYIAVCDTRQAASAAAAEKADGEDADRLRGEAHEWDDAARRLRLALRLMLLSDDSGGMGNGRHVRRSA